jgi:hypothetical protein
METVWTGSTTCSDKNSRDTELILGRMDIQYILSEHEFQEVTFLVHIRTVRWCTCPNMWGIKLRNLREVQTPPPENSDFFI